MKQKRTEMTQRRTCIHTCACCHLFAYSMMILLFYFGEIKILTVFLDVGGTWFFIVSGLYTVTVEFPFQNSGNSYSQCVL